MKEWLIQNLIDISEGCWLINNFYLPPFILLLQFAILYIAHFLLAMRAHTPPPAANFYRLIMNMSSLSSFPNRLGDLKKLI